MWGTAYFDLCAFLVFLFLCFAVRNMNFKTCRNNKMLLRTTVCGALSSLFAYIVSSISSFSKPSDTTVFFLYLFKYASLIFEIVMIQFNSFYFFKNLGLTYFIRRNHFVNALGLVLFIFSFVILLSNIFMQELFFITPTLNIGTSPLFIIYYIFLGLIIFKDGVVLLCLRKYLVNKKALFALIAYFFNILFILFQCLFPDLKLFSFVFALSIYIEVSFIRRPELQENPLYEALSSQAFFAACEKIYLQGIEANILFVKIQNYRNIKMYVGQKTYLEFLRYLSNNVKKQCNLAKKDSELYYLGHGVYSVIVYSKINDKVSRLFQVIDMEARKEIALYDFRIICDVISCVVSVPKDINNFDYLKDFSKNFFNIISNNGQLQFYNTLSFEKDVQVKSKLEDILERAVRDKNFQVYYQPIYGVKEKKYVCAEALVRIDDPEFGLIYPSIFIPYAEQKEYIHYINSFVIESVCQFISSEEYKQSGLRYVGLNLSATQCMESDFIDKVTGFLEKYNISTEEIRFEIQESTTDLQPEVIEQRIQQIHQYGINFVLDGYGTGYSNIRRLKALPLEVIKLDKTFVEKLEDPETFIIIKNIISMFKHLNKQVLVEGIESKEMEDIFITIDSDCQYPCDFLQGYYYSQPRTKTDFLEFLNK